MFLACRHFLVTGSDLFIIRRLVGLSKKAILMFDRFVDFDHSARPEVITLPHPTHLPLNLRLISIQSVSLFSAICLIKPQIYLKKSTSPNLILIILT